MVVLQYLNPNREAEVRVAPFVDLLAKLKLIYLKSKIYYTRLISDCDKNRAEKEICAERIFDLNLRPGATVEYPCQLSEYRQGDHEVVAVGLNPVVAGNRSRVDMMFSKRSQEILKEEIYTSLKKSMKFILLFQRSAARWIPRCLPPSEPLPTQSPLSICRTAPTEQPR